MLSIKKKNNLNNHAETIMMGEEGIKMFKKTLQNELLKNFFELCWKNKPHYCEITKKYLGNKYSSLYLHHILPKSKYKEAAFDEENIIVLSREIHANVELDMYRYEEINKRREQLKIKYNIL